MLCAASLCSAQHIKQELIPPPSPDITVSTQGAVGYAHNLDTYLSPLENYRGIGGRFVSQVLRNSQIRPLAYSLTHEASVEYTSNRAGNVKEWSGHYDFSYGAMYMHKLPVGITMKGGAMGDAYLGGCYNTRNSANNPAQGYAVLNIGAMIAAEYEVTPKISINYEARIPIAGMMFSPNYGQSYYEIFNKGDYDRNIVITTCGTFQIRQQLSLDIQLTDSKSLRIGYLSDLRQATPNNLKQHNYFNALTVGVLIRK